MIVTYNKVKAVFPKEGVTTTVVVEADDVRSGAVAAGIARLQAQVRGSDSFLPGTAVLYSDDGTVAEIDVPTVGDGTDAASVNALDEVRDEIVPATISGIDGASVNVTGDAASSVDFNDQLSGRLPLIFGFVFGLAFLLLLVTFRSIVIPIKAIVLNLLSVGAAYGVLVLDVPERPWRVAARLQLQRRRHELAAAVPVRGPVRALDGLPRVHPLPRAGAATSAACRPRRPSSRGSRRPPAPSPARRS